LGRMHETSEGLVEVVGSGLRVQGIELIIEAFA
jgi:hypothetical protein